MKVQFPAQGSQLTGPAIQNLLSNSERAAKSGDDAAHRCDFHLTRSVAHKTNGSLAHRPVNRNPPFIDGNARRVKSDRVKLPLFEEFLEVMARFRTGLTD